MSRISKEAQKGLKWSREAADAAARNLSFIRVGKNTSARHITGAPRVWRKEPDTIYNTRYRLSGLPRDVAEALRGAGVAEADIQRAINDSITSDNYQTTKRAEYEDEVRAYERYAADKKSKGEVSPYNLDSVLWFGKPENLRAARVVREERVRRGALPRRGGARRSLQERLDSLAEDKVIDVSKLDPNTGTGAVSAKVPSAASRLIGSSRLPIVSNNLESYINAINLLENPQQHQEDINEVRELFRQREAAAAAKPPPRTRAPKSAPTSPRKKARSPRRGRATSPRQAPAQGRAPSPARGRAPSPARGRAPSPTGRLRSEQPSFEESFTPTPPSRGQARTPTPPLAQERAPSPRQQVRPGSPPPTQRPITPGRTGGLQLARPVTLVPAAETSQTRPGSPPPTQRPITPGRTGGLQLAPPVTLTPAGGRGGFAPLGRTAVPSNIPAGISTLPPGRGGKYALQPLSGILPQQ